MEKIQLFYGYCQRIPDRMQRTKPQNIEKARDFFTKALRQYEAAQADIRTVISESRKLEAAEHEKNESILRELTGSISATETALQTAMNSGDDISGIKHESTLAYLKRKIGLIKSKSVHRNSFDASAKEKLAKAAKRAVAAEQALQSAKMEYVYSIDNALDDIFDQYESTVCSGTKTRDLVADSEIIDSFAETQDDKERCSIDRSYLLSLITQSIHE